MSSSYDDWLYFAVMMLLIVDWWCYYTVTVWFLSKSSFIFFCSFLLILVLEKGWLCQFLFPWVSPFCSSAVNLSVLLLLLLLLAIDLGFIREGSSDDFSREEGKHLIGCDPTNREVAHKSLMTKPNKWGFEELTSWSYIPVYILMCACSWVSFGSCHLHLWACGRNPLIHQPEQWLALLSVVSPICEQTAKSSEINLVPTEALTKSPE